jgi:hypothetical protein
MAAVIWPPYLNLAYLWFGFCCVFTNIYNYIHTICRGQNLQDMLPSVWGPPWPKGTVRKDPSGKPEDEDDRHEQVSNLALRFYHPFFEILPSDFTTPGLKILPPKVTWFYHPRTKHFTTQGHMILPPKDWWFYQLLPHDFTTPGLKLLPPKVTWFYHPCFEILPALLWDFTILACCCWQFSCLLARELVLDKFLIN